MYSYILLSVHIGSTGEILSVFPPFFFSPSTIIITIHLLQYERTIGKATQGDEAGDVDSQRSDHGLGLTGTRLYIFMFDIIVKLSQVLHSSCIIITCPPLAC